MILTSRPKRYVRAQLLNEEWAFCLLK